MPGSFVTSIVLLLFVGMLTIVATVAAPAGPIDGIGVDVAIACAECTLVSYVSDA